MNKIKNILLLLTISIAFFNCNSDESSLINSDTDDYVPVPTSPVSIDLSTVPYPKLSDYRLFDGELKDMKPSYGVHPYSLNAQLFTDYASKKRFVWMPNDQKASFVHEDEVLNFPTKTVLVKSFYYTHMQPDNNQKILETRIMIKKGVDASGNDEWIFANYVWNEDQTEAFLDMNGSNVEISFVNEYNDSYTTTYRIPSETECLICHKNNEKAIPIGPKPYNMEMDYAYTNGSKNQLDYWIENNLLVGNFDRTYQKIVDWKNNTHPIKDRLRSYLEINCGHCHAESKHCDYRPIRLGFYETESENNLGVCVEPQENIDSSLTAIITPNNIQRSVMHYRLNTNEAAYRMPLLGRTVVDKQAVQLLEDYIQTLTTPCY